MYDIRQIGSIRVGHPAPNQGTVGCITGLLGIGGIYAILAYVMADSGCASRSTASNGAAVAAAFFAVAVVVLLLARRKASATYMVIIGMGGREHGILASPDPSWAQHVANAIQQAMAMSRNPTTGW